MGALDNVNFLGTTVWLSNYPVKEVTVVLVPYMDNQREPVVKNNTVVMPFMTADATIGFLSNFIVLDIIYTQHYLTGSNWHEGQKFSNYANWKWKTNDR